MTDVVVVGAGPVGALLAAELQRRGVEVRVLERRPTSGHGSRAIGVHAPVLAALERSGITERLLEKALRVPRGVARSGDHVLGIVRFDRLSARFPFVATLPQAETEAVLAAVSPAPERGLEVTRVRPRAGEVELEVTRHAGPDDGAVEQLTAPIVVLAGGWTARSLVYRDGRVPTTTYHDRYLMSDIAVPDRPDADTAVVNLAPSGVLESFPLPGSLRRVVAWDAAARCLRSGRPGRGPGAATAGRPAGSGRGIRRRCGRDRHGLRHPSGVRAAAAPRTAVRDRRCRA